MDPKVAGAGRIERTEWNIVLAEDDDDDALMIETALQKASALPTKIRRANSGEEAMELIEGEVPDLLLLDLGMPGMAGHEVLERLKGDPRIRGVPVAVLTASDRDEDVEKAYGLGGNHFITKPDNPAELEAKLRLLMNNLSELADIRRGTGAVSHSAVSAVDPAAFTRRSTMRIVGVIGILLALAMFGKLVGAF